MNTKFGTARDFYTLKMIMDLIRIVEILEFCTRLIYLYSLLQNLLFTFENGFTNLKGLVNDFLAKNFLSGSNSVKIFS